MKVSRILRRNGVEEIAHAKRKSVVVLHDGELFSPLKRAAKAKVLLEEGASPEDVGDLKIDMVELDAYARVKSAYAPCEPSANFG